MPADVELVEIRFKIPAELKERLDTAAEERLFSSNKLAELAIEHFLERLVPVSELNLTREPADG